MRKIEPKLAEWCKEQERIELATQPKAEEAQASESDPRMPGMYDLHRAERGCRKTGILAL